MTFRQNVILALIDLGITQNDICKGANITNATLSNALNKPNRSPSAKTLFKVKTYLEGLGYNWED